MKKFLLVLVIVIITVICTVLVKDNFFPNTETITETKTKVETTSFTYYQTSNQDNLTTETSLQASNLKVTLKYFSTDGINEDDLLNIGLTQDEIDNVVNKTGNNPFNCIVEFSTVDGSQLNNEISYDFLVYDNAKNILTKSIIYNTSDTKNNAFLQSFVENTYNSSDVHESDNYLLGNGYSKAIVKSDDTSIWALFTTASNSNEDTVEMDLSEVHVLIVSPTYNDEYLQNQIFEFILNNSYDEQD